MTPNGGDITVAWSSGQIFTLFEALRDRDRPALARLRDWVRDAMRAPGLWVPEPRVVLG